jgi:hypothetical protein
MRQELVRYAKALKSNPIGNVQQIVAASGKSEITSETTIAQGPRQT